MATTVMVYLFMDVFNEGDSIELMVSKGYKVNVSIDNTLMLTIPFIDTLNNLVTLTNYTLVEIKESSPHVISATTNIPSLVCLGCVKSIIIVFEHLSEISSSSGSL